MMQDQSWHRVTVAAADAGLENDKAGGLRGIHVRMYDEARTASECFALEEEALAEVARIAAEPKPRTIEDRLKAVEDRLR